jgi:stage II sporulation protein D
MPQYGAYGYARDEGKKHDWILAHYYKGTTLGNAPISTVRVLLTEGRASIKVGSTGPFTATDARGRTFAFPAKTLTLGPGLKVTVGGRERTLASPVTFKRGSRNLQLGGHAYRGKFVVRSNGSKINVVNSVSLEQYLFGVVPDEMPPSWSPEALKAQAVAARSYAVVSRKTSGNFDLYDDTRSQVYGGVRAETDSTNAAVNATRGRVVRWHGELAWTLYHSTSGGKTASRRDEWGLSGMPYLASVNDPYDRISPHHTWGPDAYEDCAGSGRDCVWSAGALKRALGGRAPGSIRDFRVVARNGSSRVERTRLGPSGAVISGGDLRAILGLRSTWFSIGVLRLTGGGSIDEGQSTTLHALKRNLSGVVLQRKVGSGAWTRVRDIHGRQNVSVSPNATTSYRLRSPAAVGRAVKVKVVQSPRLAAFAVAPGVYRVRVLDGRTSP